MIKNRLRGAFAHPFQTTVITEAMRTQALAKTAKIVGELDKIRRGLELPPEQLELVAEAYSAVLISLAEEAQQAELEKMDREVVQGSWPSPQMMPYSDLQPVANRVPMPMRSMDRDYKPYKVKQGEVFEVTSRPQAIAYRIEEIAIDGDASRWVIEDIKIGNRSQFVRSGSIRGELFTNGAICNQLRLDTAQTAMDVTFIVRYIGPEVDGEVFSATTVGLEAR